MCRNLFLLCLIFGSKLFSQHNLALYNKFQNRYSAFSENDGRALPSIRKSIESAKSSKNFRHLTYTYEDAVFYASLKTDKLKYADSTISAALKTKDSALISKSYLGKGIIYYFNFKDYNKALPQYLKAAAFAENGRDAYLRNKIKYHIGTVRTYLGYHRQAISCFTECNYFFRNQLDPHQQADLQYNYTRGYLNSLHQLMINYRELKKWDKVDSLLHLSAPYHVIPAFHQEKGYFMKEKGIVSFTRKSYQKAIDTLLLAADIIREKKEEMPLAVTYFYIGNSYLKMNNKPQAITFLKKVDSLFNAQQIIFPEMRNTYELLLKTIDIPTHPQEVLYYTDHILKVDAILSRDFPYLSSLITHEYDNKTLLADNARILKPNAPFKYLLMFLILGLFIFLVLLVRYLKPHKQPAAKKTKLPFFETNSMHPPESPDRSARKSDYNSESVQMILENLDIFEQSLAFTSKDISLRTLAASFKTNTTHVSYVVNEYKHMNFASYLKVLRINYITRLLDEDKKYLNYTVDALAEKCGMNSRQQFSNHFFQINGERPTDFITQRKDRLQNS